MRIRFERRFFRAIAKGKDRILLTLATGTGKTAIAFQIAWKLFQTRWNLKRDGSRRPRILFLADRNILANQAFNNFSAFPDDSLVRIKPDEIKKKGKVPTTGVDARNIRNIVLLRPVNSMIEFKQIVGRGTRLFDGKEFFTIYDFVDAYKHFNDPEWDGEPIEPVDGNDMPTPKPPKAPQEPTEPREPTERKPKIKVKLRDGKEREIQHIVSTSFWSADGSPVSAEEFMNL